MNTIPSYLAITAQFKEFIEETKSNTSMKHLFQMYLAAWEFDEAWYLMNNPDLNAAIPSDDFPTAFAHFQVVGYMEGRLPAKPTVDANWYMANYPDIAAAIIKGVFDGAVHHFSSIGYREGRLPGNPDIDIDWYIRTYIPWATFASDKSAECLQHFMNVGYLDGAQPRQKVQ